MPGRYAGHRSTDHPVGMSYGAYAAADPRSYRARAQLDPSVRLVDGKVTCVSCHRLDTELDALLDSTHAAPGAARAGCLASGELAGERGGLCLACHLM